MTLIFYKVGSQWWKEPALNLLAAAVQASAFTHVEVAIGEVAGKHGEMQNVVRIFNDNVGVELCSRTGRNPQYTYLSIGCSQVAEARMLAFARSHIGKPFSNMGMARSVTYPRTSDYRSFYCAELVAAVLKAGGLLSSDSNPGSATPSSLYKTYKSRAAVTANPYALRKVTKSETFLHRKHEYQTVPSSTTTASATSGASGNGNGGGGGGGASRIYGGSMRRQNSPPRAPFRLLSSGLVVAEDPRAIQISLASLRS